MTLQATLRPPAQADAYHGCFLVGALRSAGWKKEGFCGRSTRVPFKQLVVGSSRNPGYPRAPIWKGRLLSGEALRVVHELKSAQTRKDQARLSQVIKSKVARLVQFDLLAVFNELRRQNECDLALLVFDVIRKEFWYKPEDGLLTALISTLAQNKRIEDIEQLYVSVSTEGMQESVKFYTDVLSTQVHAGNLQKAIDVYSELRKVGHPPCNPALSILRKALIQNGDHELVATLDQEYRDVHGHDVDAEREDQVDGSQRVGEGHNHGAGSEEQEGYSV